MNDQNKVNETLKSIFSDSGLVNVICSLYDQKLTSEDIGMLLNFDKTTTENYLEKLLEMNLVKVFPSSDIDYYMVTNPKLCDSILMLKDAIYSINTKPNN